MREVRYRLYIFSVPSNEDFSVPSNEDSTFFLFRLKYLQFRATKLSEQAFLSIEAFTTNNQRVERSDTSYYSPFSIQASEAGLF